MKKGFFITFEGGEGAGKTSLIDSIKKYLESKKLDYIVTREPGGTKLGEHLREIVLQEKNGKEVSSNVSKTLDPKAELCLFLASRAQHIKEVILPSLEKNKIVLCDRYNDSSIAYQGHARDLGIDKVIEFSSFIIEDATADLTIYLDIDPKIGLSRVESKLDRIESEKMDFHQKIRDAFHILAKKFPKRIKIIDATESKEDVLKKSINYISKLIDL
ncbi:MAG: Thymidylate kinase [Candidatus Anoxychlamydiales bacterium]|nr:Thymidylate kinase [Candidatus Anoxychlamydiales bacterium]